MKLQHALLAATLLAASTLLAQEKPNPNPNPRPRDPRFQERNVGARPPSLTPEERAKVQEVTAANRAEQRTLMEKLRAIRTELNQLATADPVDVAAVRAKGAELGQAEAELALLRGRQFQALKGVLPEEKLNALRNSPALMPGGAVPPQTGQRLERVVPRAGQPTPPNQPVRPAPGARRSIQPQEGE